MINIIFLPHLQCTVIGPSCPNCSLVLCTCPMKSIKPSPVFGTPCSGQSVNWNWRIVLDWPSWGAAHEGVEVHLSRHRKCDRREMWYDSAAYLWWRGWNKLQHVCQNCEVGMYVTHACVRDEMNLGLERCRAVSCLMTVKCIYSPLKLLHHREFQHWPLGIGGYAFHVFSQWSQNIHAHTRIQKRMNTRMHQAYGYYIWVNMFDGALTWCQPVRRNNMESVLIICTLKS